METCERAVLARLRTMTQADFAALDQGREGLSNRLYEASRTATSVRQILEAAKTKRYAYARLRRMVLWAYLGLTPADCRSRLPYLRVLAANGTGRELLARMRETAEVPVLTKPNHVRRLNAEAQELFALETRAADLYALAYPDLSAAEGSRAWKEGPVIL
jgi:predicted nucleotidyltransferase